MVNKLSKITSHLVYVASSNNAQIWINSDVWLSFSHKLFRTCMAHYICISEMSRATEITISRAAVKWPMHVIRNKPSFVLYLISDYLLGGCIAVRWGRWGLSLDLTVTIFQKYTSTLRIVWTRRYCFYHKNGTPQRLVCIWKQLERIWLSAVHAAGGYVFQESSLYMWLW